MSSASLGPGILSKDARAQFQAQGFLVCPGVIDLANLDALRSEADRLLEGSSARGGARNALGKSALLRTLGERGACAVLARGLLAQSLLGEAVRPVKLTVFDKSPLANWKVPWHQDLTIAVSERLSVAGFGPWSQKDGVPHVQPPASVLEQMLAIRVHLDDTPRDNGALRVLAGSHLQGRLAADDIDRIKRQHVEQCCELSAGDALVMRPLLLHASAESAGHARRRVLHYEYAAIEWPGGLCWKA